MSTEPKSYYDDLADWAESDEPTVRPGTTVLRGEAARTSARALLDAVTEDDPADREMIQRVVRSGRPTLDPDAPGEVSPHWQVRAPRSLDIALRAQAKAEGRTISEVLRDAASEYLAARAS